MYLPANHAVSTYLAAQRATVTPDHVRCYSHYPVVYCRVPRLPPTPVSQRLSPTHPSEPWPRGVYLDVITPIIVHPTPPILQPLQRLRNHEIFHPRPGRLLVFLPVVWDYSTSRQSRDLRVLCEFNYWEHETNNTSRAHFIYPRAHDVAHEKSIPQLIWCVCDYLRALRARAHQLRARAHATYSYYRPMCVFLTIVYTRA